MSSLSRVKQGEALKHQNKAMRELTVHVIVGRFVGVQFRGGGILPYKSDGGDSWKAGELVIHNW